jgi:hypothetical protein
MLPLRDVCYLLDGLRELAADPPALAAHRADLPALAATLSAAVHRAAGALETTPTAVDHAVGALLDNLAATGS